MTDTGIETPGAPKRTAEHRVFKVRGMDCVHARRASAIIRHNISLSLAVKAVFVSLTFAGHASLLAAIAADMGVTLVVVADALRLLRHAEVR